MSNRAGSNILGGIVTTMISAIDWRGRTTKDLAVLELDERSSRLVFPHVHPDLLLCTNLFRDSFKRNAHSEFIFDILDQNIPASTKLVLNGDDLISARLAPKNDRVYFGVLPQEGEEMTEDNRIQDMPLCPYCGARFALSSADIIISAALPVPGATLPRPSWIMRSQMCIRIRSAWI